MFFSLSKSYRRAIETKEREEKPSLTDLFLSFLKLGTTAFGGPAMIPYIGRMAVEKRKWLDWETFRDGVALCQTIPGATAMQVSAYVGFRARGVPGAAASFIGFGLPAFLLMTGLSAFYVRSYTLPPVAAVFHGLQTVVVAIVASATVSFAKTSLKSFSDAIVAIIAAAMFGLRTSPILVIVLAALAGILIYDGTSPSPLELNSERESQSTTPLWVIAAVTLVAFVVLFVVERKLFDLAALMFRIDLFAFGGGFASVPLMFHEIVEVRSWIDGQTFLNGIALGQITPGPIVITATFVGYLLYGLPGGVVATASIFLPSFLIVNGIIPYFDKLKRSLYFSGGVRAILCSFVGLLLMVTVRFATNIPWDIPRTGLALAAFLALLLKVEIVWIVLAGTAISIWLL